MITLPFTDVGSSIFFCSIAGGLFLQAHQWHISDYIPYKILQTSQAGFAAATIARASGIAATHAPAPDRGNARFGTTALRHWGSGWVHSGANCGPLT
jgi:hypothetical protein